MTLVGIKKIKNVTKQQLKASLKKNKNMRKISILIIIVFILTIFGCSVSKTKSSIKTETNSLKPILEKYQDSLIQKKYGLVASIRKNGKIEKYAIGLADTINKMETNKIFNIASLTKMFTSVLILQEIEKGNLKLNDTLGKFFQRGLIYNKNVDTKITIENLLRHESGLGEVVVDTIMNQAFSNPFHEYNNTLLYNKIPKKLFEKGTNYEYTNTNYILLGYILEVINEKPYFEILKERIFKPCEMTNSHAFFPKNDINIAHPMYEGMDLFTMANYKFYYNYAYSAGCIFSNLDDLNKFFITLYETDKLINRNSFNTMCNFKNNYGYGIEKIPTPDKNVYYIGHSGDDLSYTTRNFYNPKSKVLVIIMSNHLYDKYCWKIGNKILFEYDK